MPFEKLKQRWTQEQEERKRRSSKIEDLLILRGRPVFEKYAIQKVVVFGSVADDRSRCDSDIDILVSPLKNREYWAFRHELEEAVDMPIDLYTDTDDSIFVKKVLSRGKVLYEI